MRHKYAITIGGGKRGHIVADTLLLMMFLGWTNDCVRAAQTGKHLFRIQDVSDKNQKHFLCLGHKVCVRNKCCAHGQKGKHLSATMCPQHCVLVCHHLMASSIDNMLTTVVGSISTKQFVS